MPANHRRTARSPPLRCWPARRCRSVLGTMAEAQISATEYAWRTHTGLFDAKALKQGHPRRSPLGTWALASLVEPGIGNIETPSECAFLRSHASESCAALMPLRSAMACRTNAAQLCPVRRVPIILKRILTILLTVLAMRAMGTGNPDQRTHNRRRAAGPARS